jgi:hypothetical protein
VARLLAAPPDAGVHHGAGSRLNAELHAGSSRARASARMGRRSNPSARGPTISRLQRLAGADQGRSSRFGAASSERVSEIWSLPVRTTTRKLLIAGLCVSVAGYAALIVYV